MNSICKTINFKENHSHSYTLQYISTKNTIDRMSQLDNNAFFLKLSIMSDETSMSVLHYENSTFLLSKIDIFH